MEAIPVNIKDFCYAVLIDTAGVITYETPVTIPGLMEIKLEMKTEESKLSGDGKTRVIINTEGDLTLEATLNSFPMKDRAALLGRTYDPIKGTLLTKEGDTSVWVAAGFKIENQDGTDAFNWLYKGKFSQPSKSYKQKEEGKVTFPNPTLKGTFIADDDGEKAIVMDEAEGSAPPENFLSAVYKIVAA